MGAATAYCLARAGHPVTVFERFHVGHKRGSSHGPTRIFRLSYPEARYVALAAEARELWRRAEDELGERLLVTTGGLDLGDGIDANAVALTEAGVPFELLDAARVAARWPFLHLRDSERALFQPDAGVALADRAVAAFTAGARARGADIVEHEVVTRLTPAGDGVELELGSGRVVRARVAVVTAGAWARDLLAGAGIELPVKATRETVAYFRVAHPPPPSVVQWGRPLVYALASSGGEIKAGEHLAGHRADPNQEGVPDYTSVERVAEWVAERFPGADPAPTHVETCLYTNTADESFILERHGPIVVGSACSGHGFKFAPAIGERLAALASA
jgi:sarcosine oxidase